MIENFKLPRTITTSWSDVAQIGRYTWNYPTLFDKYSKYQHNCSYYKRNPNRLVLSYHIITYYLFICTCKQKQFLISICRQCRCSILNIIVLVSKLVQLSTPFNDQMQSDSNQSNCINQTRDNINVMINKNELLETTYEHDQVMIRTYQSQVKYETLKIDNDSEIKDLNFIQTLKVKKLELKWQYMHILNFQNNIIKELHINSHNLSILKMFQLDNLEILVFVNSDKQQKEAQTLVQEIVKFQQLKIIHLNGWIIDLNLISQMTNLKVLSIIWCGQGNIEVLKTLRQLKELYLDNNYDLDIIPLQYLTTLSILSLNFCSLLNIDILRPLQRLQALYINQNQIIYLYPLIELKQLSILDAEFNIIVDIKAIQQHPKFLNFDLDFQIRFQNQPTAEQLIVANTIKDIDNANICLKQIRQLQNSLKSKLNILREKVIFNFIKQQYNQDQLITQVVSLYKNMNTVSGYQ
ncbi:leucine-rich_repeat domain-containing protein [Hexamita inflata]|uniref:Leucine-rich repeat domain-containing protein n=1 Tax=Hexamita inflata TaxID=28002 RepID=A0AA86UZ63_9EUKA|nr:leucine-rich repeat domain-containing protein [Hexamita inflata]